MSITHSTGDLPEHTVENRSEYAKNLHRPHDEFDEPVPACEERNRPEADFRLVRTEQMLGFRTPCRNPACFGEGPAGERNGDGDGRDEDRCPSCGGPERRREVTEAGQAVIAPCGCEVSLRTMTDGGLRFSTTDNVEVTDHARDRWSERAGVDCDVDDAWRGAIPIEHPSAPLHSGMYARYHRRGDVVLLAHRATVLTVLERRQPPQGRPGNKPGGVTQ